jgi:hypothetical protein
MNPGAVVKHLGYIKSDHRPILLDTEFKPDILTHRGGSRRFEAKWLREPGFRQIVEKAWEDASSNQGGVLAKLSCIHAAMHEWDTNVLKKPKKRLRKAQRELEEAMTGQLTDENEAKAKEMANLIELLLEQEEVYW